MKTKEQIEDRITLLKGNVNSKLGILNDPTYPSTFIETQLANERITEMKTEISALKWVLDN